MRIAFSNFDDLNNPWYAGGGARAIHEVARRLVSRHQVTAVTGNYPSARPAFVDGVAYKQIGAGWAGPRLGQLIYGLLLPLAARRTPHDVWVESLTPPFSTGMLPWFTKCPVVALTQILGGLGMRQKYGLPFDRIERLGIRHYRYAIALSEVLKRQLLGMNAKLEVEVIPNGVPDQLIARIPKKTDRHVLFLGRLDRRHKGLDLLLQAWAAMPDNSPPLVVAGSGSQDETSWLERHPLVAAGKVTLTGRVSGDAKLQLMDEALYLVMPSRYEGFPLVLPEAFCHALPVVLYSIPELSWLPEDCCVKLPPFDVAALTNAMVDLLKNSERRQRMGAAARVYAGSFGWSKISERYESFLARVAARSTDSP